MLYKRFSVAALVLVLGILLAASISVTAQDNYDGHVAVLGYAEYITADGVEGGITYFRQDLGNGQLTGDFVYNDPRRAALNGGLPGVTFGINTGFQSADPNLTDQIGWLRESATIWDTATPCSNMGLTEVPVTAGAPGVVQRFFQTGVINADWQADLTQVGFLSPAQFPYFAANPNVLGVTFTLVWSDGGGLTDIDANGKTDVAFREIYYNDNYNWADNGLEGTQPDGTRLFDFPTVAIHEVGHGYSAAHFGSIGRTVDGALVANPRSIMNAIYGGTLRELAGRDVSSHCSNWSQWPNR